MREVETGRERGAGREECKSERGKGWKRKR